MSADQRLEFLTRLVPVVQLDLKELDLGPVESREELLERLVRLGVPDPNDGPRLGVESPDGM